MGRPTEPQSTHIDIDRDVVPADELPVDELDDEEEATDLPDHVEPEVSEADAIEQHQAVPGDDEYR